METNYKLPKDLNESLKNMEDAIIPSLLDSNKRFTIEFNFEGLKFNRIGITIYKILSKNNNVFITFADQGAVALAQRDYPDIKDKIFTFKSFNESNNINNIDSVMISILPQPYDFDSFEPMSDNYQGTHYTLNPKLPNCTEKHGSGCVLSSAITAYLALGYSLEEACASGKRYTEAYLSSDPSLLGYHKNE